MLSTDQRQLDLELQVPDTEERQDTGVHMRVH